MNRNQYVDSTVLKASEAIQHLNKSFSKSDTRMSDAFKQAEALTQSDLLTQPNVFTQEDTLKLAHTLAQADTLTQADTPTQADVFTQDRGNENEDIIPPTPEKMLGKKMKTLNRESDQTKLTETIPRLLL